MSEPPFPQRDDDAQRLLDYVIWHNRVDAEKYWKHEAEMAQARKEHNERVNPTPAPPPTEKELDERLHTVLVKYGKDVCPNCGRCIDRGDMAWFESTNESGTDIDIVMIECQRCDTELFYEPDYCCNLNDGFEDAIVLLDRLLGKNVAR